jgi:hypothetical protein
VSTRFFHFGWFQNFISQNFLQPWWKNSRAVSTKFFHFGWFQNFKIQNFL